MKHLRWITTPQPAKAQFESVLQLIAVISGLLSLINQFGDTLGTNKGNAG